MERDVVASGRKTGTVVYAINGPEDEKSELGTSSSARQETLAQRRTATHALKVWWLLEGLVCGEFAVSAVMRMAAVELVRTLRLIPSFQHWICHYGKKRPSIPAWVAATPDFRAD
jgi:hypothetical protein